MYWFFCKGKRGAAAAGKKEESAPLGLYLPKYVRLLISLRWKRSGARAKGIEHEIWRCLLLDDFSLWQEARLKQRQATERLTEMKSQFKILQVLHDSRIW